MLKKICFFSVNFFWSLFARHIMLLLWDLKLKSTTVNNLGVMYMFVERKDFMVSTNLRRLRDDINSSASSFC